MISLFNECCAAENLDCYGHAWKCKFSLESDQACIIYWHRLANSGPLWISWCSFLKKPKILWAIFGRDIPRKVFLKKKRKKPEVFCTAPQIVAKFSRKLPHNNLNSKVTLLSLLLFIYSPCAVFLGFCNVSVSCHLTVKVGQIISDYWLFAWMNWKRRSYTYSS